MTRAIKISLATLAAPIIGLAIIEWPTIKVIGKALLKR